MTLAYTATGLGCHITTQDGRKGARVDHAQHRRDIARRLAREQARALMAEMVDG